MRRSFELHGYWIAVATMSVAILVLGAATVIEIGIPELERAGLISQTPTPQPSAAATAEPTAGAPILMAAPSSRPMPSAPGATRPRRARSA